MFLVVWLVGICLMSFTQFKKVESLDLSNWMAIKKEILWNKTLQELTILGTHDSGSYNLTKEMLPGAEPEDLEVLIDVAEYLHVPLWVVITRWSRSQPTNLYNQMMNGVRYFDLRCGWMSKWMEWVAFHGEAGQAINMLMSDVKRFLDEHSQEIVLIEASHLDGYPTQIEKEWLANNFTEIFGDYLFPVQTTFPSYGNMITSGHRVFLSLDDEIVSNYTNLWPGSVYENTYADTAILSKMLEFNNEQVYLFDHNQTNNQALFKISWTLTPQTETVVKTVEPHSPHTLLELAAVANSEMWQWVSEQLNQSLRIGNIFLYDDYPTASITEIINALYN